MAVDPRLMTILPDQTNRIVPDRLDVLELEISAIDEHDGAVVPLTVGTWTVSPEKLVRVDASVSVSPVDFHHTSAAGGADFERFEVVIAHEILPCQRAEAAAVRARTDTVACCASS